MLAAARGVQAHERAQALRALLPITVGHAASVALVAGGVAFGLWLDRALVQSMAGALLVIVATLHLWSATSGRTRAPVARVGLALWSFMMATAHGAGLMLVPALIPDLRRRGAAPAREITASGSLMLGLAAVGVHTLAMLAVTGAISTGACRGFAAAARWLRANRPFMR